MDVASSDSAKRDPWQESRAFVHGRLEAIGQAAAALVAGAMSDAQGAAAKRAAGDLVDPLTALGLPDASEQAQAIEALLAPSRSMQSGAIMRVCDHTVELTRLVEARDKADPQTAPKPVGHGGALQRDQGDDQAAAVWLVGQDPEQVAGLGDLLTARGWTRHLFRTIDEARASHDIPLDHLVVTWQGGEMGTARFVRDLRQGRPQTTILVLGREADLDARVEAAEAGADQYLPVDLPPDRIVAALRPGDATADATRILVVDDDPQVLAVARRILGPQGYDVCTEEDPERFWATLEDQEPALVVLDLDMPSYDGLALCRALRTDAYWASVPVLFLTTALEVDLQDAVWAAGGDDLVAKPIDAKSFLVRVRNRLGRTATIRQTVGRDPDTGTPDSTTGRHRVNRLIALAQREGQSASIAVVVRPESEGDPGPDELDRRVVHQLRRALRGEDIIYRDGHHIFVASYGQGRRALAERIEHAFDRTRAEGIRPHAAVAGLGPDGATFDDLVAGATQALQDGSKGRSLVLFAGGGVADSEHPDIVIVEEDASIAGLLRHALEANGYEVKWFDNGMDASGHLAGAAPSVRPRLILLEVNLPGFDGLSLLRMLRNDGILERTNVIMLSARTLESEVIKALRLGADDHIAKPFSIPVLLERVRIAMGE